MICRTFRRKGATQNLMRQELQRGGLVWTGLVKPGQNDWKASVVAGSKTVTARPRLVNPGLPFRRRGYQRGYLVRRRVAGETGSAQLDEGAL